MEILGWSFICLGVFFVMLSGIGLIRMPSFFMKIQVVSKASTMGTIFSLIGMCILHQDLAYIAKSIFMILFLLLSTPVATHAFVSASKKAKYK